MLSPEFVEACISFFLNYPVSQIDADRDTTGFGDEAESSATPDVHAVSEVEALSYYAGLPSEPTLLYRTGKAWSPPSGLEAQRRSKRLCEVFNHPIAEVWNRTLGWKVVEVLDAHKVYFTTIDVVRFKMVKGEVDEETGEFIEPVAGPVTIWIGVFPEVISPTTAHDAAQVILALLKDFQITDVDVDFRESLYMREAGSQLLPPVGDVDALVDVISPLTPTLGLHISTKARPRAQGTMALYLEEGGDSERLLGLSCRHVLIGSKEPSTEYVFHPSAPARDILLLGNRAFNNLVDSLKLKIGENGMAAKRWRRQIKKLKERERDTTNADDIAVAKEDQIQTEARLHEAELDMVAFGELLVKVNRNWRNRDNRVLGHILCSPPITFGVGEERFTEDWGIFQVDRAKLGPGFQGNTIDLGTKMKPDVFLPKRHPCGDESWEFGYFFDRLLTLKGIVTDQLMRNPDMWDKNHDPCLIVIKSGNTTNTTIGRANGVFSIVREYLPGGKNQTSMEWAILNYDSKSGVFSEPGDSGSIIVDIRGRIGGMLTGGSGNTQMSDMTYATPFWWLLNRIRANGFPNVHLDVAV